MTELKREKKEHTSTHNVPVFFTITVTGNCTEQSWCLFVESWLVNKRAILESFKSLLE